jgi:hypothetical protein
MYWGEPMCVKVVDGSQMHARSKLQNLRGMATRVIIPHTLEDAVREALHLSRVAGALARCDARALRFALLHAHPAGVGEDAAAVAALLARASAAVGGGECVALRAAVSCMQRAAGTPQHVTSISDSGERPAKRRRVAAWLTATGGDGRGPPPPLQLTARPRVVAVSSAHRRGALPACHVVPYLLVACWPAHGGLPGDAGRAWSGRLVRVDNMYKVLSSTNACECRHCAWCFHAAPAAMSY